MSRDGGGRGSRNAQCVPSRSEQRFIKSNLFEGGTQCEHKKEKQQQDGGQTCGFQMFCLFFASAVELELCCNCNWKRRLFSAPGIYQL